MEQVVKLKWFCFDQNNSGGRFRVDEKLGHYVFIQAESAEEAKEKAHDLLDASNEDSCPCCGDRWYFWVDDSDGTDVPMIYGKPLEECGMTGREVRLHRFDGSIESIVL